MYIVNIIINCQTSPLHLYIVINCDLHKFDKIIDGVSIVTIFMLLPYLRLVYLPAIDCQAFTVIGGSVAFSGTTEGSTAVVTCGAGFYADNGDQEMTVTCRSTGQWTFPNPECSSEANFFVRVQLHAFLCF